MDKKGVDVVEGSSEKTCGSYRTSSLSSCCLCNPFGRKPPCKRRIEKTIMKGRHRDEPRGPKLRSELRFETGHGRRASPVSAMLILLSAALLLPKSNGYMNHLLLWIPSSRVHTSPRKTTRQQLFRDHSSRSSLFHADTVKPDLQKPTLTAPPLKSDTTVQNSTAAVSIDKTIDERLIACETSSNVLAVLASIAGAMTQPAGGQKLNSTEFSAALHKIAHHLEDSRKDRARTLSDPRFAMFLCALGEALVGYDGTEDSPSSSSLSLQFTSRDLVKIAQSLAHLHLAPPKSTLGVNLEETATQQLVHATGRVRELVMEVARSRMEGQHQSKRWIPVLSLVAARVLDCIALSTRSAKTSFNTQETVDLLSAFATSQRADARVFDHAVSQFVQNDLHQQALRPHDITASLSAFVEAKVHGEGESDLIRHVADLLDNRPEMMDDFDAEELSDTVWSIANIVSHKWRSLSAQDVTDEDQVIVRLLRRVARATVAHADEFSTQELSRTAFAFATLGFGLEESELSAVLHSSILDLQTDDIAGDKQLMVNAFEALEKTAIPRLSHFQSEELTDLVWAFSRLGRMKETALYEGVKRQFVFPSGQMVMREFDFSLWAYGTLDYFVNKRARETKMKSRIADMSCHFTESLTSQLEQRSMGENHSSSTSQSPSFDGTSTTLQDHVTKLETRVRKLSVGKQSLIGQLKDQNSKLDSLTKERDEAVSSQVSLKESLSLATKEFKNAEGRLDELETEKRRLSKQLALTSKSAESIEARLNASNKENQILSKEKEALLEARDALAAQISRLGQSKAQLEATRSEEAENLASQLLVLQIDNFAVKQALTGGEKEATQARDESRALSAELQKTTKSLEDSLCRLSELENEIRLASQNEAALENKITEGKNQMSELLSVMEEQINLETRLEEETERRKKFETDLQRQVAEEQEALVLEAGKEIEALQKRVEELLTRLSETEAEVVAAQLVNEELLDINERLENEAPMGRKPRASENNLKRELTALSEKYNLLQKEFELAQNESISLVQHEKVKAELARVKGKKSASAKNTENLRAEASEARREKERLTKEFRKMKGELLATILSLQGENHQLHDQIRDRQNRMFH